jgi:hypothetical protein
MQDIRNLTRLSVSTNSIDPLRGVVEIDAADFSMKFELNEELAHRICTELERFLTQAQPSRGNSDQRG